MAFCMTTIAMLMPPTNMLHKLVKLTTLESTTEDTKAMVQFWSLFNEVYYNAFLPYIVQ